MNISLRAIRYFVAACELGSLTKAAEQVSISNSAISAAIDAVEQEFGVQLLLRQRSKGVVLTPAGRNILSHAKHLIEEYDHFLTAGNETNSQLKGTLKVGYFAPISPAFFPHIIRPLLAHGEDVYVDLIACNNDEAQEGLRAGTFDVALFLNYAIHSDISVETLMEIPPYLIVSKNHHLAKRSSVQCSELQGEDFILLNLPTTLEYYSGMLKRYEVRPNIVIGASNVEMVRSLVAAELGCSILNMRPMTDQTYFGSRVVYIPLSDAGETTLDLTIGYLPGPSRKLSQAFVASCRAYFETEAAQNHRVIYQP